MDRPPAAALRARAPVAAPKARVRSPVPRRPESMDQPESVRPALAEKPAPVEKPAPAEKPAQLSKASGKVRLSVTPVQADA